MNRQLVTACAVIGLTAMTIIPIDSPGEERRRARAVGFTLSDQFGRSLTYRFPKQKVSVLTLGDWKGSSQIEGWVRPIWNRYRSGIDIHGIAVLDIVPEFAQDFAREQFRKQVKHPVLLDFSGDVAKGYSFKSDNANVVVIAPDGTIALRIVGEVSPAGLTKLYAAIDELRSPGAKKDR